MKHTVKDNKDVIHNGVIYKPVDGIVDLPDRVENDDIKPIEETKEEIKPVKKGK